MNKVIENIKFIAFLFYRYYCRHKFEQIPYARTIASLTIYTYVQFVLLILAIDKLNMLPENTNDPMWKRYAEVALALLPIALFYLIIAKKSELEEMRFSEAKIKAGNRFLLAYLIVSVLALVILSFARNGK